MLANGRWDLIQRFKGLILLSSAFRPSNVNVSHTLLTTNRDYFQKYH
jgi:hypothetical protein